MKVIHITPAHFSNESILGGGERFFCGHLAPSKYLALL